MIKPSFIMTILSAIVIASVWSWVTYIVVAFTSWWILIISLRVCTLNLASRLLNGSSIKNTLGCLTIALPSATLWRCPPLSSPGFLFKYCVNPKISAASFTRLSTSALLICTYLTFVAVEFKLKYLISSSAFKICSLYFFGLLFSSCLFHSRILLDKYLILLLSMTFISLPSLSKTGTGIFLISNPKLIFLYIVICGYKA